MVAGSPATGTAGQAGARAARLRREEEEEDMATLESGDPAAFEFKILRSAFGAFRSPTKLKVALEEEARFGWDLLEKLDDSRLRLRRRVESRARDSSASGDPYRTYTGMTPGALIPVVVGATLVAAALAFFLMLRS